jgi:DNA-damage-inducible protein J
MSKDATVRARIQPDLKKRVETMFEKLGLSTTEAITLFYRQVDLRRGLPFDVVIPNKTTRKTLEGTDAGRNLIFCKDADDMFKKLGI